MATLLINTDNPEEIIIQKGDETYRICRSEDDKSVILFYHSDGTLKRGGWFANMNEALCHYLNVEGLL